MKNKPHEKFDLTLTTNILVKNNPLMKTFIISIIFTCLNYVSFSQLIDVEWRKNVIQFGHNKQTVQDKYGNFYTLAGSRAEGWLMDQYVTGDTPSGYALIKINPKGEKIWIRTLGSDNDLGSAGALAVDDAGNIIVAGAVLDSFHYNGNPVSSVPLRPPFNAFILKVDPDGNLLWYKNYHTAAAYIFRNNLVTDAENNIYTIIAFRDSLEIDNKLLYDGGYLLLKLDPSGNAQWGNLHNARYNNAPHGIRHLHIYTPQAGCPQQLLVVGMTDSTLVIGDDTINNSIKRAYLLEYTTGGSFVRHALLPQGYTINGIKTVGSRIFLTGNRHWPQPIIGIDLYVAELDELLNIKQLKILAEGGIQPTHLQFSPSLGLVVCGFFDSAANIGGHVITLWDGPEVSPPSGGFMAVLSSDFKVNDVKYIKGGEVSLRNVFPSGDQLIGLAFSSSEVTNYFNNDTLYFEDGGTVLFKTKYLQSYPWGERSSEQNTAIVYPNPFSNSCTIKFANPIYGYTYNVYNYLGQLCHNAQVDVYNDNIIRVNLAQLAAGTYVLKMKNCCDETINIKLVKQ